MNDLTAKSESKSSLGKRLPLGLWLSGFCLCLSLFGGNTANAAPTPRDPIAEEIRLLDGTWRLVASESKGEKRDLEGQEIIFKNGTMTFVFKPPFVTDDVKEKRESGTFKINPTASPKTIDFFGPDSKKGPTDLCIYAIEGDTFKLCIHRPKLGASQLRGQKERPSGFGNDADTSTLYFKRVGN